MGSGGLWTTPNIRPTDTQASRGDHARLLFPRRCPSWLAGRACVGRARDDPPETSSKRAEAPWQSTRNNNDCAGSFTKLNSTNSTESGTPAGGRRKRSRNVGFWRRKRTLLPCLRWRRPLARPPDHACSKRGGVLSSHRTPDPRLSVCPRLSSDRRGQQRASLDFFLPSFLGEGRRKAKSPTHAGCVGFGVGVDESSAGSDIIPACIHSRICRARDGCVRLVWLVVLFRRRANLRIQRRRTRQFFFLASDRPTGRRRHQPQSRLPMNNKIIGPTT